MFPRLAVANRLLEHSLAEPVDLKQDHSGHLCLVVFARTPHPSAHHPQMASVAIDVEQRRNQHRDERQPEGDRHIAAKRRCLAVNCVEGKRDHPGAQQQRAEPERDDRKWQSDACQQRPQQRVDQSHCDRHQHRRFDGQRFESRQQPRHRHQRQALNRKHRNRPDSKAECPAYAAQASPIAALVL
jgi:hypothetical protein